MEVLECIWFECKQTGDGLVSCCQLHSCLQLQASLRRLLLAGSQASWSPKGIVSHPESPAKSGRHSESASASGLKVRTAFHPQTDGQRARADRTLKQISKTLNAQLGRDWSFRCTANPAYDNSVSASAGHVPFFFNTWQHPVLPNEASMPVGSTWTTTGWRFEPVKLLNPDEG